MSLPVQGLIVIRLLPMVLVLCVVMPSGFQKWKRSRRQKAAVMWPRMPGRVRGASVRPVAGAFRLNITYNFTEPTYGNDLWWHDFASKAYAEHAKQVLTNRAIEIRCNPDREGDTELLWSDLQATLAREPFVPQLLPLSRRGYVWARVFAAVPVMGFIASIALYVAGLLGGAACLCEIMLSLIAFAVLLLLAATAPLTRMTEMAPRAGLGQGTWWLLHRWQRVTMVIAILAALVSFFRFAPAFRALPMDAEVPAAVVAGTLGVLPIPIYLFCAIVALETLRRRRPHA